MAHGEGTGEQAAAKPRTMTAAARRVEIARASDRIRNIQGQREALKEAVGQFGTDFDAEVWENTMNSQDSHDMFQINAVRGGYDSLVMNLTELIKTATQLTGAYSGKPRVETALDVAVTEKALTRKQADLIERQFKMRSRITHASPDVTAEEFREHIIELQNNIARLSKRIVEWYKRHDVDLTSAN